MGVGQLDGREYAVAWYVDLCASARVINVFWEEAHIGLQTVALVPREILSGPHFIVQARAGTAHFITIASEDVGVTIATLRSITPGLFDNEKAKKIVDWRTAPPYLLTHMQNEMHFQMSLKKVNSRERGLIVAVSFVLTYDARVQLPALRSSHAVITLFPDGPAIFKAPAALRNFSNKPLRVSTSIAIHPDCRCDNLYLSLNLSLTTLAFVFHF